MILEAIDAIAIDQEFGKMSELQSPPVSGGLADLIPDLRRLL